MKISEVIERLTEKLNVYGDCEVVFNDIETGDEHHTSVVFYDIHDKRVVMANYGDGGMRQ